jgi:hypothetical protein
MKIIVTSIWLTFFWYLVFCFISMSIYPEDWGFMTRCAFAIFVCGNWFIVALYYETVKNTNPTNDLSITRLSKHYYATRQYK